MPLYEYRCPACGAGLEVLQKLGESGEGLSCSRCDHQGLERQLSCCVVKAGSPSAAPVLPPCGAGSPNCGFS